jgi:hypothetical protein
MSMTRMMLRLAALPLFCGALFAQESHAYVFAGPGGISAGGETGKVLYGGMGAEVTVGSGIGLGAEAGVIRQVSQGWHGVLGIASANVYYHFIHGLDRSDPFVTVGYSSAFRGAHQEAGQDRGQANLLNFGGGLNYWFQPNLGLKLEFRDHLRPKRGPNADYWSFRFGLTFAFHR